jgi:hypothetical protein
MAEPGPGGSANQIRATAGEAVGLRQLVVPAALDRAPELDGEPSGLWT